MYKNLGKEDYLRFLGLKDGEVNSLIVFGGWNPSQAQLDWSSKAAFKTNKFFYPLFVDSGVAVTQGYGDAMMSEIVHIFAVLGIKKAVLIGTFGALQPGIDFGQVFLPSSAVPEDGASRMYSAEQKFYVDETLRNRAKELWSGYIQQTGDIVSISAMLAETWEMITEWKSKGYTGVDLESASFLAVTNHFKVPAVIMHTLADNLVEQQTVLSVSETQGEMKRQVKDLLFEKALELVKQ